MQYSFIVSERYKKSQSCEYHTGNRDIRLTYRLQARFVLERYYNGFHSDTGSLCVPTSSNTLLFRVRIQPSLNLILTRYLIQHFRTYYWKIWSFIPV